MKIECESWKVMEHFGNNGKTKKSSNNNNIIVITFNYFENCFKYLVLSREKHAKVPEKVMKNLGIL